MAETHNTHTHTLEPLQFQTHQSKWKINLNHEDTIKLKSSLLSYQLHTLYAQKGVDTKKQRMCFSNLHYVFVEFPGTYDS